MTHSDASSHWGRVRWGSQDPHRVVGVLDVGVGDVDVVAGRRFARLGRQEHGSDHGAEQGDASGDEAAEDGRG